MLRTLLLVSSWFVFPLHGEEIRWFPEQAVFNSDRTLFFQFESPTHNSPCLCEKRFVYSQAPPKACRLRIFSASRKQLKEFNSNSLTPEVCSTWHNAIGWSGKDKLLTKGFNAGAADPTDSMYTFDFISGKQTLLWRWLEHSIGLYDELQIELPHARYCFFLWRKDKRLALHTAGTEASCSSEVAQLWTYPRSDALPKLDLNMGFRFSVGADHYEVIETPKPQVRRR